MRTNPFEQTNFWEVVMENSKNFDVQSVLINADVEQVFNFVANPSNLPNWTNAFKQADNEQAILATPEGEVPIKLEVKASKEHGTVDWYMYFPDGSLGTAYSRVTPNDGGKTSVYTFVLMAPPVPLEQLEGALEQQKAILAEELENLSKHFG